MAKSTKSSETKVTRIKAAENSKPEKKVSRLAEAKKQATRIVENNKKSEKISQPKQPKVRKQRANPIVQFWRYLKGSWAELQQVRWPDRKSTWGMTGALILFTLFFVIVIIALDYGFSQLFKLIMGN